MKTIELKGKMPYSDIFDNFRLFIEEHDNIHSQKFFDGKTTEIIFMGKYLIVFKYATGLVYTDAIICPVSFKVFSKSQDALQEAAKLIVHKFKIRALKKTEIKNIKKSPYF